MEKALAREREADHPWFQLSSTQGFSHFFVLLGAGRETILSGRSNIWHPPTDVYETDTHVMVKVEVAGVSEDDFEVRLQGRTLVVAGRRDDPAAKLAYQQSEISYGAFCSEVYLPCDVDETGVQASYENGFLYVMLPRRQQEHKVPVVVLIEHESH
jgi:HSP20 family protein